MWGLRRSLLPWMQYHTQIGVCRFYVAYQGSDNATLAALRRLPMVRPLLAAPPFAPVGVLREWARYTRDHEGARRPGNHRLMAMQDFCGRMACRLAAEEGMHWLAHIDVDELVLPATTLQADLDAVPTWASYIKMHNHEALVESVDVVNKYEEVTLFKTHEATMPPKPYTFDFRTGTRESVFLLYYNGKSIVRTDQGPVRPWGPHDFMGEAHERLKHPVHNAEGKWRHDIGRTTVLHMPYTHWRELMTKANISCPRPEFREAALRLNGKKLSECLTMPVDRAAFVAAARGEAAAEAYWVTEMLLSEGAVRGWRKYCQVYRNVSHLKHLLVSYGLARRELGPQQVLRAHEIAIRDIAERMGVRHAVQPPPEPAKSMGEVAQT
ncbi:hypothetical protein HYH03_013480 [Edaphochlamys debaryana]|nr:hypothetical protein HYH03_013480 [Edaphochlamys debaryana]|eukprot:KAG2487900.1 hypothetical protein HYH03_013480 [Edaphochlamys debaryana]